MNAYYDIRSSCPAALFSFVLLDVPFTRCNRPLGAAATGTRSNGSPVRLRRPYWREAPAGFGLGRLATAFMKNPG